MKSLDGRGESGRQVGRFVKVRDGFAVRSLRDSLRSFVPNIMTRGKIQSQIYIYCMERGRDKDEHVK